MKKLCAAVIVAILLACVLVPSVSFTEDKDTILLARTIYAMARDESYDTKLAVGSVVMNRVENPWFADSLGDVLEEQQQFPSGSRYDDESLRAAHDVLSGKRTLRADALYYQSLDASQPWGSVGLAQVVGGYAFYYTNGNI